MFSSSRSSDPRLERIFDLVPREAFLGAGPWKILVGEEYVDTPSADPIYLYQNVVVALDASKGINNGAPFLHARWIGAIAPQPGEFVTQIGVGTGYYTAILSMLVRPGGRVHGIELQPELAALAQLNLKPFDNATVISGDAVTSAFKPSDIIYVSAGVVAPPIHWLSALRTGGRLIFPWRPSTDVAMALLVTRMASGLSVQTLMQAWFIPCVGASQSTEDFHPPEVATAWRTRSLHLVRELPPDESATSVHKDVWFSSKVIES